MLDQKSNQTFINLMKDPKYENENLVFALNQPPNSDWIELFKNQLPTVRLQFPTGQELVKPLAFVFTGDLAMLPIPKAISSTLDAVLLWNVTTIFVTYLNEANSLYEDYLTNKGH